MTVRDGEHDRPRPTPIGAPIAFWTGVRGRMIHARRVGEPASDSNPIVMLHGTLANADAVLPLAARLGSRTSVYVPDLPQTRGAGQLSRASDILAWIAANSLEPAVVAGFGHGAGLACAVAIAHPTAVSRLILVGPCTERPYRGLAWLRAAFDPALVRRLLSVGPRAARDGSWFGPPLEPLLDRVGVPTLVLRGASDPLCTHAWATRVAARLPEATLRSVPGLSHEVGSRAVAPLERIIAEWLDGRPAAAARMQAV